MNYRVSIGPDGVATERVLMCRCGVIHTGDYAEYDYGHHMCFHDAPLWYIDEGHFCCADCGKDFFVERKPEDEMRPEYDIRGGERGKYLSRWQQILSYLRALYR